MNNKIILESLASDLKRVALGLGRGSNQMAERFYKETLKRKNEVDKKHIPKYIRDILNNLQSTFKNTNQLKKAEDMLMYSTLVQNYVLCKWCPREDSNPRPCSVRPV